MSDSIADVMEPVPGEPPKKPKSDLGVRTVSAVVMIAISGTALWLGGWFWAALAAAIAIGVLWEWQQLVFAFERRMLGRTIWIVFGLAYVGVAAAFLGAVGYHPKGAIPALIIIFAVISVDVGAYAAGRTFGGPKIAPKISPSKTWSGLGGGMAAAAMVGVAAEYYAHLLEIAEHAEYVRQYGTPDDWHFDGWQWQRGILLGFAAAIIAQAGDFFESWMKRRAGVKDSGKLLPGHGGLFDRVDGTIAVAFAIALTALADWVRAA